MLTKFRPCHVETHIASEVHLPLARSLFGQSLKAALEM